MDKAKKRKLKQIIAAVCAVAVVAILAAMPLIAKNQAEKKQKSRIKTRIILKKQQDSRRWILLFCAF